MIEIKSKSYEVLESGMAMTADEDAGLEMHCNLLNELDFTISIEFEEREGEIEVATEVDPDNSLIRMIFRYAMTTLSFGLREPMEIAKLNGKTVYIRVWVTPLGNGRKSKKVEYVLYRDQGDGESL